MKINRRLSFRCILPIFIPFVMVAAASTASGTVTTYVVTVSTDKTAGVAADCTVLPVAAQRQTAMVSDSSAAAQNGGGNLGKPWSGPWTHGSVTVGYTYLWADQGADERINLNGWFAKPSINIARGWSAFADFTNYDGRNSRGPLNSHGFTFGGQKSFFSRVKLGVFAEAGDLRTSNVTVTNSFLFNVGENISVPLAKHFDLALTPAEYVMIKPPNGQSIRNDFNTKVGFSIHF